MDGICFEASFSNVVIDGRKDNDKDVNELVRRKTICQCGASKFASKRATTHDKQTHEDLEDLYRFGIVNDAPCHSLSTPGDGEGCGAIDHHSGDDDEDCICFASRVAGLGGGVLLKGVCDRVAQH